MSNRSVVAKLFAAVAIKSVVQGVNHGFYICL